MASKGATDHRGHPVQIVKQNENGRATFDLDALSSILHHPSALNRKLAVISVVGVLRGGKSSLLNYMLRFLEADGAADWLDGTKPLEGFSWRGGHDRTTVGIWMWSKPFVQRLAEDDEKVAVLLVDTQGTHDPYSSSAENTMIFVLSTLMSSVQTYNLKHSIDQRDLQYLRLFTEYAAAAAHWDSDSDCSPLQKLVFLVRDYTLSSKRGFVGGRQLLDKVLLQPSSESEEPTITLQRIVECFDDFDCYLMSYPGDAVTKPDFDGNITGCTTKFQRELNEYVDAMLAPNNLLVKTVNGDPVTGASLLVYAQMYADALDKKGVDQAKSIAAATIHGHLVQIHLDAVQLYSKEMRHVTDSAAPFSETAVKEKHQNALGRALTHFDRKVKLGGASAKQKERQALIDDIKVIYVRLIIPVNNATRAAMEMQIDKAVFGAFKAYLQEMDATQYDNTTCGLNAAHEEASRNAVAHLSKCVKNFDKTVVDEKKGELLEDIEQRYKGFQMKVNGNPLGDAVLDATAEYDNKAERFMSPDVSEEVIQEEQQQAKDKVISRIRQTNADPVLVEEVVADQTAYMDRQCDRTRHYRESAKTKKHQRKSLALGGVMGVGVGVGALILGVLTVSAAAGAAPAATAVSFAVAAAGVMIKLVNKYFL